MSSSSSLPPLRIGMLGAGTVGGGVYEILMGKETQTNSIVGSDNGSRSVVITKLCVQSLDKARDFTIHTKITTLTTNWKDLLADDIDCVVEVAGGCGVAKDLILEALALGKMVVTANKAVLFQYMTDIQKVMETTTSKQSTKAQLGYEAAVCGGIPIINTITTALQSDSITLIQGICNGTTNFMLSHMQDDATVSYEAVLQQAQALGYAEQDPSADVDGHDVQAKINILAQLAFGASADLSLAPNMACRGIRNVTALDFELCRKNGLLNDGKDESASASTIKLVGTAQLIPVPKESNDDDAASSSMNQQVLSVYVGPTVVPSTHALASIAGSGNAVSIATKHIGVLTLTGPGAGRYPTAQSVCADVYRAANGTLSNVAFPQPRAYRGQEWHVVVEFEARFYVRVTVAGGGAANDAAVTTTAMEAIAKTLTESLPIDKTIYKQDGTIVVVTMPCLYSSVSAAAIFFSEHAPLIMPILEG